MEDVTTTFCCSRLARTQLNKHGTGCGTRSDDFTRSTHRAYALRAAQHFQSLPTQRAVRFCGGRVAERTHTVCARAPRPFCTRRRFWNRRTLQAGGVAALKLLVCRQAALTTYGENQRPRHATLYPVLPATFFLFPMRRFVELHLMGILTA